MKQRQRLGLVLLICGLFILTYDLLGALWMIQIDAPDDLPMAISAVFSVVGGMLFMLN